MNSCKSALGRELLLLLLLAAASALGAAAASASKAAARPAELQVVSSVNHQSTLL
jgi:ABC-type glycerol-3-phosphate transport system substrate-binding protein